MPISSRDISVIAVTDTRRKFERSGRRVGAMSAALARLMRSSEAHFRACRYREAANSADDALRAVRGSTSARLRIQNLKGLAFHLLDQTRDAHDVLSTALDEATSAAAAGHGDDSYVDIGYRHKALNFSFARALKDSVHVLRAAVAALEISLQTIVRSSRGLNTSDPHA